MLKCYPVFICTIFRFPYNKYCDTTSLFEIKNGANVVHAICMQDEHAYAGRMSKRFAVCGTPACAR